jgi:uncharacterized protein YndB with AHSA1/START domain
MNSERIVKTVVLAATRERVWRAISDSREFGTWFGARIDGAFEPGVRLKAAVVPTAVDADIAARQKPYDGLPFDLVVERVEPMERLSFRWHPGDANPAVDYSQEPMTLVTFELQDAPGGTRLTITESGFDQIPLRRRADAFKGNEDGWTIQLTLIQKYLAAHPVA